MWLPLQLLMFSWFHFAHGFRFPNEGKELKSSKVQKEGTICTYIVFQYTKLKKNVNFSQKGAHY